MTTKKLIALIVSGLIISTAGASDVISERESGFKGSKRAVATIKDALAEGNMATVATSAKSVADFAERIPSLFPAGSKGGIFSAAKEDIWRSFPDFVQKSKSFQVNAQALAALAVAPSPDKAAVNEAFAKVTADCKSCHQPYKKGW
ncbi:c-type cytochrome [Ferribacterium limneticum]|uniref:c-type cytochrome n=1 Tax=Ferribacterium limneticum TaxID=76259 RepID=UPI001CFB9559|nr:cytochrome c [Ferribacterium limneticum]UCV27433.1 cytochrome c [Ferribacterium limneticum]UCV31350.1 cytochrome c [Ferribacterium limneticum]